jgi:hypothetical protein
MRSPRTGSALERAELVILTLFALASVWAVIGIHPLRAPDSASYLHIDLLGRSTRLWTIPLLFRALPNDRWRVGGQTAVFIGAWVLLARTIAGRVEHRVLRLAAVVSLLGLGLATIDWNVIILSESLATSFTVIGVATWLRLDRRSSTANAVAFVATALLWTFTRQANVLLIVPIAAVVILASVRRRPQWRSVAAALAVVAVWAVATVALGPGDRPIQRFNSMAILVDRILPNANATAYFESRGLPVTAAEQGFAGQFSPHTAVFLNDGALVDWVDAHFLTNYGSYLASHPPSAVSRTARGVAGLIKPVRLGFTHLRRLGDLWRVVWGVGSLQLLGLVALLGTLATAWRRRLRWSGLEIVGWAGVALAGWWLLVVWLLSATELGRLSVSANILLRVALIALVVRCADVMIEPRSAASVDLAPAVMVRDQPG